VRTADLKEANTLLKLEIEQRILAEKTIFTQRDQLVSSAKMKALGQMASGIAHEINNPLAIILSSAEIINSSLAQNPSDIPKSIKYAQKISNTTLRIGRIVKALLNFAREGDPVVFSLVRVAKLFEDTLDLCRERFKTHHIELRTSIPGEDMQIECHAVQITQVLLNILNNAHDTLEELNDKWVELKAHDGGEFIEIRVTDSGHGIPVAIREKLFDPFFTTKEVGRGTGLGLSISKGIVDLHQGSLFIDVEKSNTCFVIRLPKAQPRK
jgi:C4-dicarboxylate-specific signal transduction histidine kinase